MPTQSKNGAPTLHRLFGRGQGTGVAFAGFFFACHLATAQTSESVISLLQVDSAVSRQASSEPAGLAQVVKVIVDRETNRIILIGSKEDVAVILRAIKSINERISVSADPTVTEKVVLQSQLSETVAAIMEASLRAHNPGGQEVKINAVHFPEAILLSGPASAVKRAKELLATIDRYEVPSDSDSPAPTQIY